MIRKPKRRRFGFFWGGDEVEGAFPFTTLYAKRKLNRKTNKLIEKAALVESRCDDGRCHGVPGWVLGVWQPRRV